MTHILDISREKETAMQKQWVGSETGGNWANPVHLAPGI